MSYDIAFGSKRKDTRTQPTKLNWKEIVERFKDPAICDHTLTQYANMSKAARVEAKDVGFFIGGLAVKRRVTYRGLLALDIDDGDAQTLEDVRAFLRGRQYIIHSTHSSTKVAPRYRVLAPLSRVVLADEYGAILRTLLERFKLPLDIATFDFNRIMFMPSICKDAEYFFEAKTSGKPLDVDGLLGTDGTWKDLTDLEPPTTLKVQDPKFKGGIVGAFCSKISIREAIETFLQDVWKKESNGRYSLIGSTTFCGGVIYEDKYLYSNHSSDPFLGRCHNAYDAVRLYKFGDTKQSEGLMNAFCESLGIRADSGKRHALTIDEMTDEDEKTALKERLEITEKGELTKTLKNAQAIMTYDPVLRGLFGYDLFAERPILTRTPPWRELEFKPDVEDCKNVRAYEEVTDTDESFLRLYFEEKYEFDSRPVMIDAMNIVTYDNAVHPVRDYLDSLVWDGVERLKNIFIDCFGVDRSLYVEEVGIKFFTGAVRRIYIPASKMDYIPVLVGSEGLGKSKFIKRMAKIWGSDTFYTFNGSREAYEQLRGVWIVEIPELNGVQSKSSNSRKAFITKGEDRYRSAYLKYTKTYKRQCVFIASSNDVVFLDDPSEGGRRWWALMCNGDKIKTNVFADDFLELVDQYWAEAVHYFKEGVLPVLSKEAEKIANEMRTIHKVEDLETGALSDYLNMPVPDNWAEMTVFERRVYWKDGRALWRGEPRDYVCGQEIAREFYEYERKDMNRQIGRKIADGLRATGLFKQTCKNKRFGMYGVCLAWERIKSANDETEETT